MNDFNYYNPVNVIFGETSLDELAKCTKELGTKVLIVSYEDTSFYGDLINFIRENLVQNGVEYKEFYKVTANPTIEQCEAGIELCKESNCDVIVGLGGGSVMDCAKMIAAGALYKESDIRKMVSFSHSDTAEQIPPSEALPTIMIPTLPATGSEMNPTAVVTDEKLAKKSYLWAPDCLYPKYALVKPSLSKTLPNYHTACAAIDTIAHVLESYFNGSKDKDLIVQDNMQIGVMKAVYDSLKSVLEYPGDIEKRGVMQWSSAIALNGWLSSGTYGWAPMHQMAHVLGARYHATHGATLATMILAWMKFFLKREDNYRYKKFAKEMFGTSLAEAIEEFEEFIKSSGVQTRISEFGVKEGEIDALVEDVVSVSFGADNLLASTPALTKEDVKAIYNLSFGD